ncbi:hypothetical protein AYO44_14825 [Planctomycetaceae bacterium SCGC AG-212-F19]|nr:hypothetical protein AYO44_14825 [Planctomycetaceae bacterium SCGC AG-212-F19]
MSQRHQVLGIFAKQPIPGQVKTRLAKVTSPEWAARVAEAFLRDTLARLATIPVRRVLAYAPEEAGANFAALAGPDVTLVPQVGADLGERLSYFFLSQCEAGATATVVVGTDSPTLPVAWVEQAFAELEHADIVLGPATDGGYYLIGIGERMPPIFDGVRWGTEQVLADTIARLPADFRLALLPPWYDVDSLADWQMLRGHLAAMLRAGMDPGLPRTIQVEDYS